MKLAEGLFNFKNKEVLDEVGGLGEGGSRSVGGGWGVELDRRYKMIIFAMNSDI